MRDILLFIMDHPILTAAAMFVAAVYILGMLGLFVAAYTAPDDDGEWL